MLEGYLFTELDETQLNGKWIDMSGATAETTTETVIQKLSNLSCLKRIVSLRMEEIGRKCWSDG